MRVGEERLLCPHLTPTCHQLILLLPSIPSQQLAQLSHPRHSGRSSQANPRNSFPSHLLLEVTKIYGEQTHTPTKCLAFISNHTSVPPLPSPDPSHAHVLLRQSRYLPSVSLRFPSHSTAARRTANHKSDVLLLHSELFIVSHSKENLSSLLL